MPEVLTQVDKQLSGRELDAAIDGRIFTMAIAWENGHPFRLSAAADPGKWVVPRYSTSIEAAMEVVEKMRSLGWSFACTMYEGKLPYASFCRGTVKSSRNAEADSLPEAICRAALAAMESEQK